MIKKEKLKKIVLVALMAALCFTATFINIPISLPIGNAMVHMGNTVCIIAALLLGGLKGGLAGGIGMAMFDLTNPVFVIYAPFTFVQKFMMGFVCGSLAHKKNYSKAKIVLAVVLGSFTNLIFAQVSAVMVNVAIMGKNWDAVLASASAAMVINIINAVLASISSLVIYPAIKNALKLAKAT